jgi:toxin FitB
LSLLLDTNVLSELIRPRPDPSVRSWIALQRPDSLFVSAVTQAEMLLGAALLPAGKRRAALEVALRSMFDEEFAHRVLPFDGAASPLYAQIVTARQRAGRPMSQFDAQIAAIASSRSLRLATRNVRDFEGCGVRLADPWKVSTN